MVWVTSSNLPVNIRSQKFSSPSLVFSSLSYVFLFLDFRPEDNYWGLLPLLPARGGGADENEQGSVKGSVRIVVRGVNLDKLFFCITKLI